MRGPATCSVRGFVLSLRSCPRSRSDRASLFVRLTRHALPPLFLGLLLLACSATAALAQPADPFDADKKAEPKKLTGSVQRVTLFRGQAMVTRAIEVVGQAGPVEVVVTGLPDRVLPDSLFAEAGAGIEVRAVRYRREIVGKEPRDEVRKLDEQIESTNQAIAFAQSKTEVLGKRTKFLDTMEGFAADAAKADLAKGVLDADALQKLSKFSFTQRDEIAKELLDLNTKTAELRKELSTLQRQRSELTGRSSQQLVHEAILFLHKHNEGKEPVELSYLVGGCGWSPSYNIRANEDGDKATIEYSAVIQQMTGEHWNGVKLTLSTATPSLSAQGPGLAIFEVALTRPRPGQAPPQVVQSEQRSSQQGGVALQQLKAITQRQMAANSDYGSNWMQRDNLNSMWAINRAANDWQEQELTRSVDILRSFQRQQTQGEGPSFDYELPTRVSLASRNDQQMVRILQNELDSKIVHVAIPVLSPYVYRQAEMTNTSGIDLMRGPINVYLGNRFVGRAELDSVARGQGFVVGFGADSQLRTKRELIDRNDEQQGGNRKLALSYRLTIENYQDRDVDVRLYDRRPYVSRSTDIKVEVTSKTTMSQDELYVRDEAPKGILRWDLKAPAKTSGAKATAVNYTYTLEFDRSLSVTTPRADERQQADFEQMQMRRLKK